MDKISATFLLPSPNFSKSPTDAVKTMPYYLTPSGMTLLPRSKQPPPMYGARGATVPSKYMQEVLSKQTTSHDSAPQVCTLCEMELASIQDMHRHNQQHDACPIPDCKYEALPTLLDKHIESSHVTGLYNEVKKMSTPEEIDAWRQERKKRYPTVANVLMHQRAKEQRQRRGERLDNSRSRFGKIEDRKRAQGKRKCGSMHHDEKQINQGRKLGKCDKKDHKKKLVQITKEHTFKKKENAKDKVKTSNLFSEHVEIEDCCIGGIQMFKGTSSMLDYKHLHNKKATETNKLAGMLGMYGSDYEGREENEVDDSDRESDVVNKKESKDRMDSEYVPLESISNLMQGKTMQAQNSKQEASISVEIKVISNDSDDEGPDEAPIERIVEPLIITTTEKSFEVVTTDLQSKETCKAISPKRLPVLQRKYGLDYRKSRFRKQNTMLEKLLESDIRHERNILLQCVRFVCENNYFAMGQHDKTKD